ncbi:MAG: hypothetical protein K2H28_10570 [Ruminococcus sp.]|nr:hypothetical protein [Ruminococcus sp.]
MQEASRVINILTNTDYSKIGALSEELNSLNTQIEDLSVKIKTSRKIQKYKSVTDELKTLSGRSFSDSRKYGQKKKRPYSEAFQK